MADPIFQSKLRTDFETFIIQKRVAGYPYVTSAKILGYLDTMIAEHYPDSELLSKEMLSACIRAWENHLYLYKEYYPRSSRGNGCQHSEVEAYT